MEDQNSSWNSKSPAGAIETDDILKVTWKKKIKKIAAFISFLTWPTSGNPTTYWHSGGGGPWQSKWLEVSTGDREARTATEKNVP